MLIYSPLTLVGNREFDGSLLRHHPYVFLDVTWLANILKPILDHKDKTREDGSIVLDDVGNSPITLKDPVHIESWKLLKEGGIFEPDLAPALWPRGLHEFVLPMLQSIGLTFPLSGKDSGKHVVLLRVDPKQSESARRDLRAFSSKHSAVLKVVWEMFRGVPPGMIEKALTKCCCLGDVHLFWRFGVLVRGRFVRENTGGPFALLLEYSEDKHELLMEVHGDAESVAPWAVLSYAISVVRFMTLEFPGLKWIAALRCPEPGHATSELAVSHEVRARSLVA